MVIVISGLVCGLALLFYWTIRPGTRRSGIYLPDFYLLNLLLYACGSLAVFAGSGDSPARTVSLMAELALFSGCIGVLIGILMTEHRYPASYHQHSIVHATAARNEIRAIYWGLGISAIVCLFFTVEVLRSNAIGPLLSEAFRMDTNDPKALLEARKAITTGSAGYFAPGYVKQFRDTLVPILLSALILIASRRPLGKLKLLFVWLCTGIALFAMLVAGVRSNLFLFFVTLFVAWTFAHRGGKRWRRLLYILSALVAYGTLTVLLGRANSEQGFLSLQLNILGNLLDRIVAVVPRFNIDSFYFWTTWNHSFGSQWLTELKSVLPGSEDVGLLNFLHEYSGGSLEGNASLGLPADIWLNWGWIGLAVFPALYGLFVAWFDCALVRMRSPVSFGIKIVLALALVKIYSPVGFALYGGLLSLVLYAGLGMMRGKEGVTIRWYAVTAAA